MARQLCEIATLRLSRCALGPSEYYLYQCVLESGPDALELNVEGSLRTHQALEARGFLEGSYRDDVLCRER